jgi:hypothetical protein
MRGQGIKLLTAVTAESDLGQHRSVAAAQSAIQRMDAPARRVGGRNDPVSSGCRTVLQGEESLKRQNGRSAKEASGAQPVTPNVERLLFLRIRFERFERLERFELLEPEE